MKFVYSNIDNFVDEYNQVESYVVDCTCGARRKFALEDTDIVIDEYLISIPECPILICKKCGKAKLGNRIPEHIKRTYDELIESSYSSCRLNSKLQRFSYADFADFDYDSRDLNIPGLGIDLNPTNQDGFSCPVFFDRKLLNIFAGDDDYTLDVFSESYGHIGKRGSDGWIWEWNIPFGINNHNHIVMFLGDFSQIDEDDKAILWFKSYNIASDHDVLDTEFYKAQFQNIFSEPIIERRIINLRNKFFDKVLRKKGIALHHLESEIEAKANEISKPVNYSKSEVKENIITLDGLLNEGIDCDALRELYKEIATDVPKNINELKTRKLLQGIIALDVGDEEAKKIIGPLFRLNDLRVCYAHLISQNEIDKKMKAVLSEYGIENEKNYQGIYTKLVDELLKLYSYLVIMDI